MTIMTSSVKLKLHHFFESYICAALQLYLSSALTSVECLASYPHVMNAFIKANSMRLSSAAETTVQCSWTDPVPQGCKLSNFRYVCVSERLSKNVNRESCTEGLAWQQV